jgi:hypothetical protein
MRLITARWFGAVAFLVMPLVAGYSQPLTPPSEAPADPGAAQVTLAPSVVEVVKLVESSVSDEVTMAYIQNSTTPYNLSSSDILYLKDVGLSSQVVTAMLSRDTTLKKQQPYVQPGQPQVPQPEPQPVEAPLTPPAIQTEAIPPPAYVSNPPPEVNYFYNDLSPYGSWVQLEGYGWCWQPRTVIVNHEWRPYCDGGHWVYSDAGWYWQSDYSWGWAAFHYGRWHRHERCGWVWLPDTVWAPAWVTWRVSGDHCGWAPLPPHAYFDAHSGYRYNGVSVGVDFDFGLHEDRFTFVAIKDFRERDLGHRRLPPTEVKNVYNHTTVINNYVVNNNTIVNKGIPVEKVAAVTHTQINKVAIRDVPTNSGGAFNARASNKNETAVYRPQLKAPARAVPMVAQKVDNSHPVIQHAAVAPVKPATRAAAGNVSYVAPNTPRRSPTDAANSQRQANVNGTTPGLPNQRTQVSNVHQPVIPVPPSPQTHQPVASTPTAPAVQHPEVVKPSTHNTDVYKPPTAAQPYQANGVTQRPVINGTDTRNSQNQNPNSHVYYPKSYYQPPVTQRPQNSQSQRPVQQQPREDRQDNNNGPAGQSKPDRS